MKKCYETFFYGKIVVTYCQKDKLNLNSLLREMCASQSRHMWPREGSHVPKRAHWWQKGIQRGCAHGPCNHLVKLEISG